jgi:anthranilate synthase component I
VIMAADARALARGIRLAHVFKLVRELRQQTDAPLLLLLYYNMIYQMGAQSFFDNCREAGVDGVIIPDLPVEEQDAILPAAQADNILVTRLVTPLSGDRLPTIVAGARGFLYCVAALGVTGERSSFQTDLKTYAKTLAIGTCLPRALGFGISTPEQVRQLAPDWDALIVGSAIVRRIADGAEAGMSPAALCSSLAEFCRLLRQALDEADRQPAAADTAAAADAPAADCFPDRSAFSRLAGTYRLIPLCKKMNADTVTPISLFHRFDDQESAWLLESVVNGARWARYSIMGRRPLLRLSCRGSRIEILPGGSGLADSTALAADLSNLPENGDPIAVIRELLRLFTLPPELSDQGFRCGLVGYFAYDFIRYLERLPDNNPDELNLPDCDLMVPGEVVLYDHLKAELTLICNVMPGAQPDTAYANAAQALNRLAAGLIGSEAQGRAPQGADAAARRAVQLNFEARGGRAAYCEQVRRARAYIRAGDIFQVVVSQRFSADYAADPFAVYRALRHVNPSPYLFYLRCPHAVLVGASPEMLVRLDGRTIQTCPIAGTRPRGAAPEEDNALADDLLTDAKELAEHAMLVDLARNDVGRISQFGSVQVKDFCHVERFSHVMHLVTLVEGQLREDRSSIDVLASLLPAGTLSGAPKIRAMEIIDELESIRRGPYGGAVGYLGFDGRLDTCITIRSALIKDGRIHVQVGAGLVADSVPENEYEETVNKAMALFTAINKAGDFL